MRRSTERGPRGVVAAWLAVSIVAVVLALLEAHYDWSAIPIRLGGVTVALTIYPPLLVTLLITLWLGPVWGVIPAYLATLASALYSGISLPVSALFALATPVELLIVWGSMVLFEVDPELRRRRDLLVYLAVAVVAAVASSLAGLIWIDAHELDLMAGERIWQGWMVGDILQLAVIAPFFLRAGSRPVRQWVDRRVPVPGHHVVSYRRSAVLVVTVVAMLGLLVFQGVWLLVDSIHVPAAARTAAGEPLIPRLHEVLRFMGLLLAVTITTTLAFATALARLGERERNVALRDALTGCFNRRAFEAMFRREAERSRRLGRGISVIFFDVDHFKAVNDRYGHQVGDGVLQQLVRRVEGVMREHDLLFRWGGEEFLILLPHTEPRDAGLLAERIRYAVGSEPLVREDVPEPVRITVSLGTAGTRDFDESFGGLVARADAACYNAKHQGRNRVGFETVPATS